MRIRSLQTYQPIVRLGGMLVLVTALLGSGVAQADDADEIKNLVTTSLGDPRVNVEVLPLPNKHFAITLTGEVGSDEEKRFLEDLAKKKVAKEPVTLISKLTIKVVTPVKPDEIYDLWPLTYLPSKLTPTGADASASAASAKDDDVQMLSDSLNKLYGGTADKPVVENARGRLLLHGSQKTVLEIKRYLALLDAPWPQVQMNLWAVQVSGDTDVVGRRVDEIMQDVRATRDDITRVQNELAALQSMVNNYAGNGDLSMGLAHYGIDLDPAGPLSLNEALVLLTLNERREEVVRRLREFTVPLLARSRLDRQGARQAQGLPPMEELPLPPPAQIFGRLQAVMEKSYGADKRGLLDFGRALACFKASAWEKYPDAPRRLVRTGATVDRVLKAVMDAFAADMDDLFFRPLLDRIQKTEPLKRGQGIALVGRTRIVVTSGLQSQLDPELASYVETTRPKPFGKDLLDTALPAGKSTDTGTLTGASRVLAGLPQLQAILLAGTLLGETEPTFSKVAPGIAIHVQPTVLPDGGSARLKIDARFGVSSTPTDTRARDDVWNYPPPPGVSSHAVKTDAVVSAFDLFDISSFSVDSSTPRSPLYVPILGRLPFVGRAFQFPRHNQVTRFESLLLVNTVILPRSTELHRFYGRDQVMNLGDADCLPPTGQTDLPAQPKAVRRGQQP